MDEIKFGQTVWVRNTKDSRWQQRLYIGTFSDRSRQFVAVDTESQVDQYRKGQPMAVQCFKYLSIARPLEGRAYKTPDEAVRAVGRKVVYKGYTRYVSLYMSGIALQIEKNPVFLKFSQAFKEVVFADDGKPFGMSEDEV